MDAYSWDREKEGASSKIFQQFHSLRDLELFIFDFSHFNYDCVLLWVCFGVNLCFPIPEYLSFSTFGKFSAIILLNAFLPPYLSLLFLGPL